MSRIFTLRNWYFYFQDAEGWLVAYGNAYGNPKFYEGKHIHTSMVEGVSVLEDRVRIITRNSIYECLFEEYIGEVIDFAKKEYFPMQEPREENCKKMSESLERAIARKLEYEKQAMAKDVGEDECCMVFEFSAEEEYYFKSIYVRQQNEEYYSKDYYVHVGTFQDSVLIENIYEDYRCEFDYRFFPYAGNYVSFYSFTDFPGNVYVKNTGLYPMDVEFSFGRFRIPPKSCYRVGEDVVLGRISSVDKIAVDKHNLWNVNVYENGMVFFDGPRVEEGQPLFAEDEEVIFKMEDGTNIQGKIVVVADKTVAEQMGEPCYDIFSEKENCLYEKIRQSDVLAQVKK